MLPSFLLALREGLEAALIIGILLGALRKVERADLAGWVWAGAGGAVIASLLAAVGLNLLDTSFSGLNELVFEGAAMLLAAALLTWMIFWMQKQSRSMQKNIESGVRRAVLQGRGIALFALAALSVLREGVELALYLLAARLETSPTQTVFGAAFGLAGAVLLGWLLFVSTRRMNLQRFFQITNVLLIFFAAGLVAHGVHEFNEVGWIPAVIDPLYNINFVLNDQSTLGSILKALFGYNGNPSLTESIAYSGYFAALVLGIRLARLPRPEIRRLVS